MALAGLVGCLEAGCGSHRAEPRPAAAGASESMSAGETEAILAFREAVEAYASLHRRLKATLPALGPTPSPTAIHERELALERLLAAERRESPEGALFVAPVQPHLRRALTQLFAGQNGHALLDTIDEENDERPSRARVNARYPDAVPLSAVPATVLTVLPPLPEELEYRFVGRDLILLDAVARLVADRLPGVLPR
jgi:hypothetical protein